MLTKRQNMLECVRGGKPDRFVNQFEALAFSMGRPGRGARSGLKPGGTIVDEWGVTITWAPGTPGPFPVHDDAHKVLKDVTKWKEIVHAPSLDFTEDDWAPFAERAAAIDRNEQFACPTIAPGLFEQSHYLMGMDDAMINFYLEPEAMHDLIKYLTEYELRFAEQMCKYMKPDAIIHHDDWGSQRSTFLSPDMFEEFFLDSYKEIYGYYHSHGVELVIHHSDSYAATLVPYMIEMGIDIWQGVLNTNDVPALVKKYGGQISFMGGINNGIVDVPDWKPEEVSAYVEQMCRDCGPLYFIPGMTAGGPGSSFGVYDTVTAEINRMSEIMFNNK